MSLLFRKMKYEDVENVRIWRMSEEVTKYLYTDPIITVEDQELWYYREVFNKCQTCVYWMLNYNGCDIGVANLFNIDYVNMKTDFGLFIGDSGMRGKGIGKLCVMNMIDYSFNVLKLNKFYGDTMCTNIPAVRCYLSCGMSIEGVIRDHVFKNGQFYDIISFYILSKDWRGLDAKYRCICR